MGTEVTTKTGNELIAEFEGWKFYDDDKDSYPNGYWVIETEEEKNWSESKDLQYDTSWDWLMPVVEKIKSCGYDDTGFALLKKIDHSLVMVNLKEVHADVVEFIKWHNEQKNLK